MFRTISMFSVSFTLLLMIGIQPAVAGNQDKETKKNGKMCRMKKKKMHKKCKKCRMKKMMKKHHKKRGKKCRHHGRGNNKWKKMFMMAKMKLDLSAETKKEVMNLYFDSKMELIDLKADKKKQYLKLKRMKHHPENHDAEAVSEQIDTLYDTKAELKKTKIISKLDLKDLLDEDQWETLKDQLHNHHHKKHKKKK